MDYLVSTRHGLHAELAVLEELSGGAWELPDFNVDDLKRARSIIAEYGNQRVGVADASNVVLAARYRTRMVATLDRRHFEVLRSITGDALTLVPHTRSR